MLRLSRVRGILARAFLLEEEGGFHNVILEDGDGGDRVRRGESCCDQVWLDFLSRRHAAQLSGSVEHGRGYQIGPHLPSCRRFALDLLFRFANLVNDAWTRHLCPR